MRPIIKRILISVVIVAVVFSAFQTDLKEIKASVAYVNTTSWDGSFDAGGTAVSNAFDAGTTANRILLVQVSYRQSVGHTISGVTYNGVSLTAFGALVGSGSTIHTRLYYLVNPASGSNTLSVDPSTGAGTDSTVKITAIVYDGVDQATPYDGYTTNTGTDNTCELTVTSAVGDTPVFFTAYRGLSVTGSAPTNYTERFDSLNGATVLNTGGEGTGASSVAFTATITSSATNGWATMGLNLNPSVIAEVGTATKTSVASGTSSTISTHTVPSGATLLVVRIGWSGNAASQPTGVTWNGTSLTNNVIQPSSAARGASIWYLANPASGNNNLVITSGAASEKRVVIQQFTGNDTTTPMATGVSKTATGANDTGAALTVSGVANDDLVIDNLLLRTARTTTAGTAQYQIDTGTLETASRTSSSSNQSGTNGGDMTYSWSGGTSDYFYVATAIKATSGGGGGGYVDPPQIIFFIGEEDV